VKVVVVGAGVIGASIADALADRGVSVTVLDMRGPARGATQASAGILAPYLEAHDHPALLDLTSRSLSLYPAFMEKLAAADVPVEFARTGTLEVALDDEDARRLQGMKAWLDARGVEAEWLDSSALGEREPTVHPSARGGLFIAEHGFVRARALVAALVAHAKMSGAIFEMPVEAASVESSRDAAVVRADDRRYEADAVVVAAGSWSKRVRVANVAALPMRPVRGQLLHLTWTDGELPRRVIWGPRCYAVPWSDRSLLVGATMEDVGFDEEPTVAGVQAMTTAASSLFPAAASARIEAIRVGLRPKLPDELPAIGRYARAPRVIAASGHYRNGVLLTPLTAALVSGLLVDGVEDPVLAQISPDRFER
jgi:glycine oxidase